MNLKDKVETALKEKNVSYRFITLTEDLVIE